MSSISILPKGSMFTRMAMCLLNTKNDVMYAGQIAEQVYGVTSHVALALRSAIQPGTLGDPNFASSLAPFTIAAQDWVDFTRPATVLGRLSGYRRAPLHSKIPRRVSGATGGFVGPGSPIKVRSSAFDTVTLETATIGAI
jgi:hypothetical protein